MRFMRWLIALFPALLWAQSVPNGTVVQGQVWSPAQWNSAWQAKVDVTNGVLTNPTFTSPSSVLNQLLPSQFGFSGDCLTTNGSLPLWSTCASGSGSVTSVAFSDGSTTPIYTITGSPVTVSGTLTETLLTQTANLAFMSPNGSTGQPSFRAIVAADIPTLNQSTTGTAANLSGTPTLPNGTAATTQTAGDATAKIATDNFVNSIFAAPPSMGSTTAAAGAFTTLSASSTVSGVGFSNYLASPPAIGSGTAGAGNFTTLSASSTVSGTGFSTYLAAPPAIGGTTAAAVTGTTVTGKVIALQSGGACSGDALIVNASNVFTWCFSGAAGSTFSSSLVSSKTPTASISGPTNVTISSGTGACATTSTTTLTATSGRFTCTGTTGASTITLTFPAITTTYVCPTGARDVTTAAVGNQIGAESTTSVEFSFTSVTANDVIDFNCPSGF
jgi:hypothetical protein